MKKNAPSLKPQTHFEQVPLEVVAKIAEIDTPFELTPAPDEPAIQPTPPPKKAP